MRSKFKSLSLINWKGYFATEFELGIGTTVLSGDNGSGKTTVMSAMLSVLMPDQGILNIKNTTESSSKKSIEGSGLYGRIGDGYAYSVVEYITSSNEIVFFGVLVEKNASRDKKMSFSTFGIEGIRSSSAITLFTEKFGDKSAVCSLNDVKKKVSALGGKLSRFVKLTDYHGFLFRYGALPKLLNSTADRFRYYKVLESAMYGGLSSNVQDRLQEYLLPENESIRSGFATIDSVLSQNRFTRQELKATLSELTVFQDLTNVAQKTVSTIYASLVVGRRLGTHNAALLRGVLDKLIIKIHDVSRQINSSKTKIADIEADIQLLVSDLDSKRKINFEIQKAFECNSKLKGRRLKKKILSESGNALENHIQNISGKRRKCIQKLEKEKLKLMKLTEMLNGFSSNSHLFPRGSIEINSIKAIEKDIGERLTVDNIDAYLEQYDLHREEIHLECAELRTKVGTSEDKYELYLSTVKALNSIIGDSNGSIAERASLIAEQDVLLRGSVSQLDKFSSELVRSRQMFERSKGYRRSIKKLAKRYGEGIKTVEQVDEVFEKNEKIISELRSTCISTEAKVEIGKARLNELDDLISEEMDGIASWHEARDKLKLLCKLSGIKLSEISSITSVSGLQTINQTERDSLIIRKNAIGSEIKRINSDILGFRSNMGRVDERIVHIAEMVDGRLLSEYFDEVSLDDTAYVEAEYGHLCSAVAVKNIDAAMEIIIREDLPVDELYLVEGDLEDMELPKFDSVCFGSLMRVPDGDGRIRVSRVKNRGIFGSSSRAKLLESSEEVRKSLIKERSKIEESLDNYDLQKSLISVLMSTFSKYLFTEDPEDVIGRYQKERSKTDIEVAKSISKISEIKEKCDLLCKKRELLKELLLDKAYFEQSSFEKDFNDKSELFSQLKAYSELLSKHRESIDMVVNNKDLLKFDKAEFGALVELAKLKESELSSVSLVCADLSFLAKNRHQLLGAGDVVGDENEKSSMFLTDKIKESQKVELSYKKLLSECEEELNELRAQKIELNADIKAQSILIEDLEEVAASFSVKYSLSDTSLSESEAEIEKADSCLSRFNDELKALLYSIATLDSEKSNLEKSLDSKKAEYENARNDALVHSRKLKVITNRALELSYLENIIDKNLEHSSGSDLNNEWYFEFIAFEKTIEKYVERGVVSSGEYAEYQKMKVRNGKDYRLCVNVIFEWLVNFLSQRIPLNISQTSDPFVAIDVMESRIKRLEFDLEERESSLSVKSGELVRAIQSAIRRESSKISKMNSLISSVKFGTVTGIKIDVRIHKAHQKLLEVLSDVDSPYQSMFDDENISFKQALGQVFSSIAGADSKNVEAYEKQGDQLLDYRKYLKVTVRVNRGGEEWEEVNSSSLSTGEMIGTGTVLGLMILSGWEIESSRLRSKDITPARFLPLDEAGRLDGKAVATLNELCLNQGVQMMVALPNGISTKEGLVYILQRSSDVECGVEYVDVVGIRHESSEHLQEMVA